MNTVTVIQKNVVMVTLCATAFGGYKRTTEADIKAAGGLLPDTDILTKGGKHIFPTERLAVFGSIKKAVYRELWKFGVKSFGSGSVIAICEDDLQNAEIILDKAEAEFGMALDDLRTNYDKWLNDFINVQQNTAAAEIIRRSALQMEDACSRFKFSYDTFMPTPVGKNGSLESMASKLATQLYAEVAQAAEDAYNVSFMPIGSDGKRHLRKVGQRAKSPIKACREKLNKLSFLDPNVSGAVEIIDSVLLATQTTGYIEDEIGNPAAKRLHGLVELMMDSENFAKAAAKVVASAKPDDEIDELCGIRNIQNEAKANVADYIHEIATDAENFTIPATSVGEVLTSTILNIKPASKASNPELHYF